MQRFLRQHLQVLQLLRKINFFEYYFEKRLVQPGVFLCPNHCHPGMQILFLFFNTSLINDWQRFCSVLVHITINQPICRHL